MIFTMLDADLKMPVLVDNNECDVLFYKNHVLHLQVAHKHPFKFILFIITPIVPNKV